MATAFAPPARRGDFLFSSVLYADPGNSNHHPRASIAELAALLRPEAPNLYSKGRKPDAASTPAKDPAWHYYSAQLIHYGLPVTKDKNAAKVRLLNAMNQFKLEVPAWVLGLEGELKKEWEAENRKLKKGGGGGRAESSKAVAGKAATAKATPSKIVATKTATPKAAAAKAVKSTATKAGITQTQSANNNVNVTVNFALPPGLSLAEQSGQQPKKPAPAKRKRADDDDDTPTAMPKKAARVKKDPAPKKEAAPKVPTTKKEPTVKKDPATKKPQAAKRDPPVKKAATPKKPIKTTSPLKQETQNRASTPHSYASNPDPYSNDPLLLTGTYSITCPVASSLLMTDDLDLTLALDSARGIWWATFRWGTWDALLQMNPGPRDMHTLGRPCTLGWRLRDLHTGALEFGRGCMGEMVFFADRTFTARLFGWPEVGVMEFEGVRMEGEVLEDDLRDEWEGFVKEAYGR